MDKYGRKDLAENVMSTIAIRRPTTMIKDATMVGFREKSGKSDQMPYFSQILVGFLGHQRNLEEFSSNSEIYLHDNV